MAPLVESLGSVQLGWVETGRPSEEVLEGVSLSSMDPGGGFGGAFGGGKAGGAPQDPMTFVKRPAVIARICTLVRKRPTAMPFVELLPNSVLFNINAHVTPSVIQDKTFVFDQHRNQFIICWALPFVSCIGICDSAKTRGPVASARMRS